MKYFSSSFTTATKDQGSPILTDGERTLQIEINILDRQHDLDDQIKIFLSDKN